MPGSGAGKSREWQPPEGCREAPGSRRTVFRPQEDRAVLRSLYSFASSVGRSYRDTGRQADSFMPCDTTGLLITVGADRVSYKAPAHMARPSLHTGKATMVCPVPARLLMLLRGLTLSLEKAGLQGLAGVDRNGVLKMVASPCFFLLQIQPLCFFLLSLGKVMLEAVD